MFQDVAIIGNAYTGAALAIRLLRSLPAGARLAMFGPKNELGLGVAYGTDRPEHLLNVRAANMSAIAEEPDHFLRWLAANEADWTADSAGDADLFVPRLIYGRYVRATLDEEIARAAGRVSVTLHDATVADVSRVDGGFAVRAADGGEHLARNVALAMGPGRPVVPLAPRLIAGNAGARMIVDPFRDERVRAIAPKARVFLLGTGLTMVDQVLALRARGHAGDIIALSRRGLLPQSHRRVHSKPVPLFPVDEGIPEGGIGLTDLFARVKNAARATDAAGGDWRAVIDGLRPVTQQLWLQLDDADRRRFGRHLASIWSVHRHRMAASIAARVASERAAGTLKIIAGRVTGIGEGAEGSLRIDVRRRADGEPATIQADWAINCSGTCSSWESEPVLASLLAAGDAVVNPYGGLRVNDDAIVTSAAGVPTEGLFALGPMSRGHFLEITAVPDIRVQVGHVARALAARVEATPA